MDRQPDVVWYVSYGSNMRAERFACYLAGGIPPGGRRACPGCRDPSPARRTSGCYLDGGVYFATESLVWGGGRAFFDPELPGTVPARAYLVTAEQFCDIAAQEMYRDPGDVLDLAAVVSERRVQVGPGRYETLLHVGTLDGHPLLTFTAPWRAGDEPLTAPSAAYVRMLAGGLRESHGWHAERTARYLAALPGARGYWTAADIVAELREFEAGQRARPGR